MLETQEIRNLILKELPILLKNDTTFRETLLEIARPHFADKLETEHRFNEIILQFTGAIEKNTLAIEKINQRLDQKIVEDRKYFDALEFRFEKLEQRLEKLELRLEKLEQRLELKIVEDRKHFKALELRLEKLEQRLEQKIVEDRKLWEKNEQRWQANDQQWEKNEQRWQANDQRWEKNEQRWQANDQRWEKNDLQWEENRHWQKKHEIAISKLDQRLMAIGARWGTDSEAAFRNGLAAILTEIPDLEVIHVDERDEEGIVFGYPEEIELDIIIKNGLLIIVEMKSSTDKSDIYRFDKKVQFYEKRQERKANKKMIISPMVHERAKSVAKNLGVEIYTYIQEIL